MATAPGMPTGQVNFDSQQSPPDQPISELNAGHANPAAEIVPATGQRNFIDPNVRSQFLGQTNFTWPKTALPGSLLWYRPITPTRANVFLEYLAGMYNVWRGGIDYKFKIAGTGFHAGALAFVRLPPNIQPESIKTVQDFTCFEYCVVDPKTLEAVQHSVMDQTQVMYHYRKFEPDKPNSFGGYICAFVMLQLNTSSSGSGQIQVQVFSKPAHDFEFGQLIPPMLQNVSIPRDVVTPYNQRMTNDLGLNARCTKLFMISNPHTDFSPYAYNLVGLNGHRDPSTISGPAFADNWWLVNRLAEDAPLEVRGFASVPLHFVSPEKPTRYSMHAGVVAIGAYDFETADSLNFAKWEFTSTKKWYTSGFNAYMAIGEVSPKQVGYISTEPGVLKMQPAITAPAGEVPVLFQSTFSGNHGVLYTLQPREVGEHHETYPFEIAEGTALLVQLRKSNGTVLMTMKLHGNGVMTARTPGSSVTLDLEDLEFNVVGSTLANATLPTYAISSRRFVKTGSPLGAGVGMEN